MEMFILLPAALPFVIAQCGSFFLIKLRAFFFVHPIQTIKLMFSDRSQLRQLFLSLAGTLGVGNIVGVAMAITLGGAGAVFWMWASALVAMVLKYAEIVLAVKYREFSPDGKVYGGPMYYMRDGVGGKFGRVLAAVFAVLGVALSFVVGNLVQARAAVGAMENVLSVPPIFIGIALAALCALSIFGGYRAASRVTSAIVPIMSAVYIIISLKIIFSNIESVPAVFEKIFSSAFSFSAAGGGIFGFFSSAALRHGVAKGVYSHEAGGGTAPLSHAQTKIKSPARQGLLGLFEVFFDTIIICTLSAFVILLYDGEANGGISLIYCAFAYFCQDAGGYIVSFSILMFAFSTLICWGYYGKTCLEYLVKNKAAGKIYLAVYSAVVVFGAVIGEGRVWVINDVGVALMTSVNLVAVVMLWRDVRRETELLDIRCRKAKAVRFPSSETRAQTQAVRSIRK